MYSDEELMSRLCKALNGARHAADEQQLDVCVNGVARTLLGNTDQITRVWTPVALPVVAPVVVTPVNDDRLEAAIRENAELKIEIEKLKFELAQRPRKDDRHSRELRAYRDEITRLRAELESKKATIVPHGPDKGASAKPRKTNFLDIAGELINAARIGGMAPKSIYHVLQALLQDFDGQTLTPNMVYGQRLHGNATILPEGDKTPIERGEIVAMQTQLWGMENNIKPMIRFIITHTQPKFDVSDYMMDDSLERLSPDQCAMLRTRFHVEMKLRAANPRYEKFSRGMALLKKRTSTQSRHIDDHYASEVMMLSERWFGSQDAGYCIGQLCGYDPRTIEQATCNHRPFPQELRDTVAVMERLVGECDPDDPDFVRTVSERVKLNARLWHNEQRTIHSEEAGDRVAGGIGVL